MSAPAVPVALRPEQVPDDLNCSICMTLPVEPLVTPCEHMFCRDCITRALNTSSQCPVDRRPCSPHDLGPPQGFALRLWSNIQVKCGHHDKGCTWTGSLGDYASHRCTSPEILALENASLKDELEAVKIAKRDLEQEVARLESALESANTATNDEVTFRYNYGRKDVVELSQLIAKYLTKKPCQIDAGKIYNCVQARYRDLESDYSDNPLHYPYDMKMLLAICEASTWFSNRQQENFARWNREQHR